MVKNRSKSKYAHGTPHFGATSAEMKESGGGRYSDEVNREKPIAVR
jgi:hypothetical protein